MIEYTVKRSKRKTVTIFIREGGFVEVRCPLNMTDAQVRKIVAEKQALIEKKLSARNPKTASTVPAYTSQELSTFVKHTKADMTMRVVYYADLIGVTYDRISVRRMRTQWGSCSSGGKLCFNSLLILTPIHVRNYVAVHELCHRKQMNHSDKFWAEVAKILPDYQKSKDWLKENEHALIARLPQ